MAEYQRIHAPHVWTVPSPFQHHGPTRTPAIQTAFLSVKPFEPVMVFDSADEAFWFQDKVRQGRVLPDHSQKWVYLPLPEGILRVRTAKNGDVAFDFDSPAHADKFNQSIKKLGRVFQRTHDKPKWDCTVKLRHLLEKSVSPFTVISNLNPAAAPPAPAHNPPALPQVDDIDPDNEYLHNLRSLFAPPVDMSNPFAETRRRHVPFTIASVLSQTDYKEEWEPKERRSDAYLAVQSELCHSYSTAVSWLESYQAELYCRLASSQSALSMRLYSPG
ncbi:hypothetical protein PMIN07_007447 [Paraphaeosphaeria minitans]